ncbi:hypothetical protein POM88_053939 [Heracleum sosnowskyi]|nr:hypothetical protein POM88_053939 [Heracleum sosnowskyi]
MENGDKLKRVVLWIFSRSLTLWVYRIAVNFIWSCPDLNWSRYQGTPDYVYLLRDLYKENGDKLKRVVLRIFSRSLTLWVYGIAVNFILSCPDLNWSRYQGTPDYVYLLRDLYKENGDKLKRVILRIFSRSLTLWVYRIAVNFIWSCPDLNWSRYQGTPDYVYLFRDLYMENGDKLKRVVLWIFSRSLTLWVYRIAVNFIWSCPDLNWSRYQGTPDYVYLLRDLYKENGDKLKRVVLWIFSRSLTLWVYRIAVNFIWSCPDLNWSRYQGTPDYVYL